MKRSTIELILIEFQRDRYHNQFNNAKLAVAFREI